MGLLDRFLKDAAKKIGESLENGAGELLNEFSGHSSKPAEETVAPAAEEPVTESALLATGALPEKPSELRKDLFYDGGEGEIEIEFSFLLSGDFVFGDCGAAEVDYYAEYRPTDEKYDEEIPCFCVVNAAEKPIHEMIERYKHGGTPKDVYLFERVSDFGEKVYFRANAPFYQNVYYFYAIDRGLTWKNCYIGVTYGENARGTALEKKLMRAVDEAVKTYRETVHKEEQE